jgi:DNA-binding CsgD family transcriptional regulator
VGVPNEPPPRRDLTVRDREVLWMVSQGMTYSQVGRRLGMPRSRVQGITRRTMARLGAASITQAVAVALLEGQIGRWPDCGSHATYQRHRKHRQTADPACMMAKAAYDRGRSDPGTPRVGPGELYWHRVTGKTIRVESVDPDGVRADVVDTVTGNRTRRLTTTLHQDGFTAYGAPRRGYIRIKEEEGDQQ